MSESDNGKLCRPGEPWHDIRDGSAGDELKAGESVGGQAVGEVVAHPVDLGEVHTATLVRTASVFGRLQ